MTIRRCTPADVDDLTRVHGEVFPSPWPQSYWVEATADPAVLIWCSEANAMTGFVAIRRAADEAEILTLAVSPQRRRGGLGTQLVKTAIAALSTEGAKTLFLEVSMENRAARALYENLGFRRVGYRKAYYADGTDALTLCCDIPARGEDASGISPKIN